MVFVRENPNLKWMMTGGTPTDWKPPFEKVNNLLVREKRREWMGCWGLLGLLLLLWISMEHSSQSRSPTEVVKAGNLLPNQMTNHSDNSSDTSTISYHTRL